MYVIHVSTFWNQPLFSSSHPDPTEQAHPGRAQPGWVGSGEEGGQGISVPWGRVRRRRRSRLTSTKHSPTGSEPRCLNALLLLPESESQQRAGP